VCQAVEIAEYTVKLANRIGEIIAMGELPLVLGGDCSLMLGSALALRRLRQRDHRRYGMIYIDGHSDFRHPGNAEYIGAAAGEGLALATGRGQSDLTNIEGLRPYLREEDVVVLGIRDHDEYRMDLRTAGIVYRTVPLLRSEGPGRSAAWALEQLGEVAGFWVHVDVDVLDPAAMPAVDAPDPGGIAFVELEHLIAELVSQPECLGMEVTVFDPDYDPDGRYAKEIADTLVNGLRPIWENVVHAPVSSAPTQSTPTETEPPPPVPAGPPAPPVPPLTLTPGWEVAIASASSGGAEPAGPEGADTAPENTETQEPRGQESGHADEGTVSSSAESTP